MQENRSVDLVECIAKHVGKQSKWFQNCEIREDSAFGCGIFAIRDIEPNESLFNDLPLMLGPTGNSTEPLICVTCYRCIESEIGIILCKNKCGFVICDSDDCHKKHEIECSLLQKWQPKCPENISFIKIKAMLIIRSLFLDEQQNKFVSLLHKSYPNKKSPIFFQDEFDRFPQDEDTIGAFNNVASIISTNAFQILYRSTSKSDDVNVNALYPIVSLMNHHCTPNTRRNVDRAFTIHVNATRKILKNEQIFMSYSQLLWGHNARRMQLMVSKQFLCDCNRCRDRTENGTNISAIKCITKTCFGLVLPNNSLDFRSAAKCNECQRLVDNKQFLQIQDVASNMVKNKLNARNRFDLFEFFEFIKKRLKHILPECSQFIIEVKLGAIWKCEPQSQEEILVLKQFCEDVLDILDRLQAGECSLKGFIAYKLSNIMLKLNKEIGNWDNDKNPLRKKAKEILKNASVAPFDLI